MTTAELESPEVKTIESQDRNDAGSGVKHSDEMRDDARSSAAQGGDRTRDESGRFSKSDKEQTDFVESRRRKNRGESDKKSVAGDVEPGAKTPAEKKASEKPGAETIDSTLRSEAEKFFTPREIKRLGSPAAVQKAVDKAKRAAAESDRKASDAEQRRDPPPRTTERRAAPPEKSKDVKLDDSENGEGDIDVGAILGRVEKLGDLDPDQFDPEMVERDKTLRQVVSGLGQVIRQLQPLSEKVGDFEKVAQEERRRAALERDRAESAKADEFFADLPREFEDVFGDLKKREGELPVESPSYRARQQVCVLKSVLSQLLPDVPDKKLYERAARALHDDVYDELRELEFADRVRKQSQRRGGGAAVEASKVDPNQALYDFVESKRRKNRGEL